MLNFITYNDLTDFHSVPKETVRKGLFRNERMKSASWQHYKNGVVHINLDTIPKATRKKYSLPTGEERAQIQLEKQKAEERNREELLNQYKAEFKNKQLKSIEKTLLKAIKEDFNRHVDYYRTTTQNEQRVIRQSVQHALFTSILKLVGENQPIRGMQQKVFEVYKTLNITPKVNNITGFARKVAQARKDISKVAVIGHTGNKRAQKMTDFHKGIIHMYASKPNMYSSRVIHDMLSLECEKHNQIFISKSSVEHYLAKPEVKNMLEPYRYGLKSFENNVSPYLPREEEQFAGDLWVMDGTPLQFYCWNDKKGKERKRVRLNLFVIIDSFSRKIVGYDVSVSEDRFNVINALKMAFKVHGHLPSELLHDNFSANKTDEIKHLKAKLALSGVTFRAAKVGNAKDKTKVERFFGVCQTTVMKLYDDYLGEGIRSKRKEGRPDEKFVQKSIKKYTLEMDEMKHRISEIISTYNGLGINEKTAPTKAYKVSPKANIIELRPEQIPFMFWHRKSITVRNSMVVMTVKKVEYYFEIPTTNLKLALNGVKIDVFYDEKDLEIIHLFTHDHDQFICECKQIPKVRTSQIGRTAREDKTIMIHAAKNKKFRKEAHDRHEEIISKGIESIGLTELTETDPIASGKYASNYKEDSDMQRIYLMENDIDPTDMNLLKGQSASRTFYAKKQPTNKELITSGLLPGTGKVYKRKSPDSAD